MGLFESFFNSNKSNEVFVSSGGSNGRGQLLELL